MKSKGFTLIEIIVSLAIFSVVAIIAIGALVRVTSANRKAQAIQSGVNNVSFIMDSMSRELRTGTGFLCYTSISDLSGNTLPNITAGSCSSIPLQSNPNDTIIMFTSSNVDPNNTSCNLKYAYLFHVPPGSATTTIEKAEQASCNASASFYPITSQSINITKYQLDMFGGGATGNPYQWVFIRLKGYAGTQLKDQSVFDVQTSISQRSNS